jgi:hypothetical protein
MTENEMSRIVFELCIKNHRNYVSRLFHARCAKEQSRKEKI